MDRSQGTPIHARVWSPLERHLFKFSSKEKAECRVFYCEIPDRCPLLKMGQCIHNLIWGPRCPHGYTSLDEGPTKRARGCSSWVAKRREEFKDVLDKASGTPSDKMVEIGEYIYLPYAHADLNKDVPFLRHNLYLMSGQPFVKKELFTIDVVLSIISFRPHAMMGGEITDYRLKIIPKFIVDLQEVFPRLYDQLIDKKPELAIKEKNYVGRKALLITVLPGEVKMGEDSWTWDGKHLETTNSKKLLFSNIEDRNGRGAMESISIKVVPTKDAVTKIHNNAQVSKETQFVD
jgi:hypothetical protein